MDLLQLRNRLVGKRAQFNAELAPVVDIWRDAVEMGDLKLLNNCLDVLSLVHGLRVDADLVEKTLGHDALHPKLLKLLKRNPDLPLPAKLFQLVGYDDLLAQIIVAHASKATDMVAADAMQVCKRLGPSRNSQMAMMTLVKGMKPCLNLVESDMLPDVTKGDNETRMFSCAIIANMFSNLLIPAYPVKDVLLPALALLYKQVDIDLWIQTLTVIFSTSPDDFGAFMIEGWQTKAGELGLVNSVCKALEECKLANPEMTGAVDVMDATSINQLPVLGGVGGWALRKRMPVLPKQTTETPDRLLPLLNLLTCLVSYSAVTRNQCLSKTTTLDSLVKWLSSKDMAVRGSACSVIRSLSRSVKGLRTGLWDAGVGNALLQLVEDAYEESENGMDTDDTLDVLSTAVATICNVVLDFSPMKGTVVAHPRMLQILTSLTQHSNAPLRLNAIWAVKNMLYQSNGSTKQLIVSHLTFPTLLKLCLHDEEEAVREQAVNAVRNLVCGTDVGILKGWEEGVFDMVKRVLAGGDAKVGLQALYVIVNIATGRGDYKTVIMSDPALLEFVRLELSHSAAPHRLAATWVLINLTWPEDLDSEQRVQALKERGFLELVETLKHDESADVRERARIAYSHFQDRVFDEHMDLYSDRLHSGRRSEREGREEGSAVSISSYIDFVRRFGSSSSRRGAES